jgi:hypothetical protein
MKLAALLLFATACATAAAAPKSGAPVVIELYTSQGCSSCPPAERLLSAIAHDGTIGGRAVVPLAFHVDYWDDLGWADPFASPAWSERQREYARSLLNSSVFTPELVIGGKVGVVGSDAARIAREIAKAARPAKLAATSTWSKSSLTVEVTAPAGADVFVAIWDDAAKTKVAKGENAGSMLGGDRVVRKLARVATAGASGKQTIPLDPAWASVGAVAFAQKPDRSIIATAVLPK